MPATSTKTKAGANAKARTRAKRATAKRRVNDREKASAAQTPAPRRARHAKLARDPGERSDGARRNVPQGDNERRGGRERSERRGAAATAPAKGQARHTRARPHGSKGRRAQRAAGA